MLSFKPVGKMPLRDLLNQRKNAISVKLNKAKCSDMKYACTLIDFTI